MVEYYNLERFFEKVWSSMYSMPWEYRKKYIFHIKVYVHSMYHVGSESECVYLFFHKWKIGKVRRNIFDEISTQLQLCSADVLERIQYTQQMSPSAMYVCRLLMEIYVRILLMYVWYYTSTRTWIGLKKCVSRWRRELLDVISINENLPQGIHHQR